MAELKTRPTGESVAAFLNGATEGDQRKDCATLVRLMKKAAGASPKMYGANIVGFGSYTYKYASGRTGDWPLAAFAPRKQHLTVYLANFDERKALLGKLGKHTMSGGCLHITRLSDVDLGVLERLIAGSAKRARESHA